MAAELRSEDFPLPGAAVNDADVVRFSPCPFQTWRTKAFRQMNPFLVDGTFVTNGMYTMNEAQARFAIKAPSSQ
jgi:hypothetical protein